MTRSRLVQRKERKKVIIKRKKIFLEKGNFINFKFDTLR